MSTEFLNLIERKMDEAMRFVAYCYMYLARPAFERFGKDGEIAIRRGLRAYGNIRGKLMRKWHSEIELPINVESVNRAWYGSSTFRAEKPGDMFKETVVFKPYYVHFKFAPCAFHDAWKEEGFEREGYRYCDEIHQEVAMAYHPNAIVEIHENLNKGDPYCLFKWMMLPEFPEEEVDRSGYEKMEKRMRENPEKEALANLKMQTRCGALIQSCLSDSLIKQFGEKGEELVRTALRDLGLKEAERIRVKLKDAGKEFTVKEALDEFDLPYGLLWEMDVEVSDGVFKADVEYCPLAELWSEIGHEKLGLMYCREIYGSVLKGLSEKADVRVPKCMMKKDSKCRFEFKILEK